MIDMVETVEEMSWNIQDYSALIISFAKRCRNALQMQVAYRHTTIDTLKMHRQTASSSGRAHEGTQGSDGTQGSCRPVWGADNGGVATIFALEFQTN